LLCPTGTFLIILDASSSSRAKSGYQPFTM
jgi:hypothetical protein